MALQYRILDLIILTNCRFETLGGDDPEVQQTAETENMDETDTTSQLIIDAIDLGFVLNAIAKANAKSEVICPEAAAVIIAVYTWRCGLSQNIDRM